MKKLVEQAAQAEFKFAAVVGFEANRIARAIKCDLAEQAQRPLRSKRSIGQPGRDCQALRIKTNAAQDRRSRTALATLSPLSGGLPVLTPNPIARRLDSERFRSTPRTCGRFRCILSLR
jgi:hypothetical protein